MSLKLSDTDFLKREMKKPLPEQVAQWFSRNLKTIIIVVVTILVAMGVWYGWSIWKTKAEEKAFMEYQAAVTAYQAAIAAKAKEIGPGMTQQGLEKLLKETFPVAEKEFEPLIQPKSRYFGEKMAKLLYGTIALKSGKVDKGVELYRQLEEELSQAPALQQQVLLVLGAQYEDKGNVSESIKYYQKIVDENKFQIKDEALFSLGRLYAKEAKTKESQQMYQRLIDEYPASFYTPLAKSAIAE